MVLLLVVVGAASAVTTAQSSGEEGVIPRVSMAGLWPGMTGERVVRVHGAPVERTPTVWAYPRALQVHFEDARGRQIVGELQGRCLELDNVIAVSVGETLGEVMSRGRRVWPGVVRYEAGARYKEGTVTWRLPHAVATMDIRNWRVASISLESTHL